MKFHHVGVACRDISKAFEQFSKLHDNIEASTEIIHDPEQNADLMLVRLSDQVHYEFIQGPVVEGFLKRNIQLYHTCFSTVDFEGTVERFKSEKAFMLSAPKPAILFDNRRVAFFQTLYGIVELLEA